MSQPPSLRTGPSIARRLTGWARRAQPWLGRQAEIAVEAKVLSAAPPLRTWRIDDRATAQDLGPALWRVFDAPAAFAPGQTLRGYSVSAEAVVDFELSGNESVDWREGVWCPKTRLNSRMRGAYHLLLNEGLSADADIYCTEQVTPFYRCLKAKYPNTIGSEYLADVPRGALDDRDVRSEDLTALTFADGGLDAVLALDVLEHIADHAAALRECARVLKKDGLLILTAPFSWAQEHFVRAEVLGDGEVRHLHPPEYHHDPLGRGALCYRYYGFDLLDELRAAGFADAYVAAYNEQAYGYLGCVHSAVIARR